ncbi:MAG TPA: CPBP family glutamic-type intramembrane protease [Verrucomicrobiae bacterium]|nr:CPBP family glutamic-type intramembrane protease [Verrucomicrobiae bacterium]
MDQPSALRVIAVYLLIVFIAGAFLAPRLHSSIQFVAEPHLRARRMLGPIYEHLRSFSETLAREPFYRFVNRCLLIVAIVGLPHFFKSLRMRSVSAVGLKGDPRHWGEMLQGLCWGFAALALAAAMTVSFHARVFNFTHSPTEWGKHIQGAAAAAAVVAIIEEILFRGALFGALRRDHGFRTAALVSSSIYAVLHFFEQPPDPAQIHWYSGLVVLGQMLRGFTELQTLIPGFFNLLLIGLLLCLAYERTGALLFSIGLHAGFVFWVKLFGFMTLDISGANSWIFGSNRLVDGWSTALLLIPMLLLFRQILPKKKTDDQ